MKNQILSWLSRIPILLLLPYLSVILIQNVDTALVIKKCSAEDFLPLLIKNQIDTDYEEETLKCQAVAGRSNLYRHLMTNEEDLFTCMREFLRSESPYMGIEEIWKQISGNSLDKCRNAVKETTGEVLQYQGEWKMIPYHEISNGHTRNGEEVFHDSSYAYLQAVESPADPDAEDFLNCTYLSEAQMPRNLEVSARDSYGYILSLSADGRPLEGEAFRDGMHLASTDITIRKKGKHYQFLCKGKGHGLGLSQYGANALAKEGKSYEEILKTYFPALDLMVIE